METDVVCQPSAAKNDEDGSLGTSSRHLVSC